MSKEIKSIVENDFFFKKLAEQNFAYKYSNTEQLYIDKINHCFKIKDWLLYVEGDVNHRCKKGIVFCDEKVVIKYDNLVLMDYDIDFFEKKSVICTKKSLIFDGNVISVNGNCELIKQCFDCIKRKMRVYQDRKVEVFSINGMKIDEWFYFCLGEIYGPFSLECIKSELNNMQELRMVRVWNDSFKDWKFVDELEEFASLFNDINNNSNESTSCKKIDVNKCEINDLIEIDGVSQELAETFVEKRKAGYRLKDIFEFQGFFGLKPHQIDTIKEKIIFGKLESKVVRHIDI